MIKVLRFLTRRYKNFKFDPFDITLFAKVFNLFDQKNELDVFKDTGRAEYTLQMKNIAPDPYMNNTLDEYFTQPDYFSAPREVHVGIEFNF